MDKIKTTLLYIVIILLIYVFLYTYMYNDKALTFDDYKQTNNQTNDIINNIINNNNIKKLNFIDLKDEEGILYKTKLDNADTILENMKKNEIMNLNNQINNIKNKKEKNNQNILESLTELYFKQYIEYINKQNAVVYNEYLRYNNPKK